MLDADLVRNKILSEEYDISSQPFLSKVLIEDWEKYGDSFQKFIIDNKMSSNMWLVAQKQ